MLRRQVDDQESVDPGTDEGLTEFLRTPTEERVGVAEENDRQIEALTDRGGDLEAALEG